MTLVKDKSCERRPTEDPRAANKMRLREYCGSGAAALPTFSKGEPYCKVVYGTKTNDRRDQFLRQAGPHAGSQRWPRLQAGQCPLSAVTADTQSERRYRYKPISCWSAHLQGTFLPAKDRVPPNFPSRLKDQLGLRRGAKPVSLNGAVLTADFSNPPASTLRYVDLHRLNPAVLNEEQEERFLRYQSGGFSPDRKASRSDWRMPDLLVRGSDLRLS